MMIFIKLELGSVRIRFSVEVHSCIHQDVQEFKEQELRKVAIENLRKKRD